MSRPGDRACRWGCPGRQPLPPPGPRRTGGSPRGGPGAGAGGRRGGHPGGLPGPQPGGQRPLPGDRRGPPGCLLHGRLAPPRAGGARPRPAGGARGAARAPARGGRRRGGARPVLAARLPRDPVGGAAGGPPSDAGIGLCPRPARGRPRPRQPPRGARRGGRGAGGSRGHAQLHRRRPPRRALPGARFPALLLGDRHLPAQRGHPGGGPERGRGRLPGGDRHPVPGPGAPSWTAPTRPPTSPPPRPRWRACAESTSRSWRRRPPPAHAGCSASRRRTLLVADPIGGLRAGAGGRGRSG